MIDRVSITWGQWTAVLGAVGLLLVAGVRIATRRTGRGLRAAALGSLGLLVAGAVAACLPAGPRWQLLPVVVGAAAAGLAAALGHRRVLAVLVGAVAVVAVVAGVGAVWAFPVLRVPAPTGPHPVGTTELAWDGPTAAGTHEVLAQVWYPAATADGRPGPYLGRDDAEAHTVTQALAVTFGVPAFLLHDAEVATARAVPEAAVATGRFPVVLFSPGNLGVRRQNTAWATELASHGYVVVALDHPFDSAVQVSRSGESTHTLVRASGDDARDDADADEQVRVRARQLSSALDELARQDADAGLLAGHLDLQRIAAAGHSLGGAAALRAAADDQRISAAIDVDGLPRTDPHPAVPVLVLVAGRGTGDPDGDAEYARRVQAVVAGSPGGGVVTVPGAAHLTFTDAPLFLPPLPSLVGQLGRTGGLAVTSGRTVEFLTRTWGE
jgi:predicted dienelactone hydrolase